MRECECVIKIITMKGFFFVLDAYIRVNNYIMETESDERERPSMSGGRGDWSEWGYSGEWRTCSIACS